MKIAFIYTKRFSFYPPDYLGRGLGGTESMLILLSRELACKGLDVTVFNCTYKEGIYDGVKWQNIWQLNIKEKFDVVIVLRYLDAFNLKFDSRLTLLWSQDKYLKRKDVLNLVKTNSFDYLIVSSKTHKTILKKCLNIDKIKWLLLPNGLDTNIYNTNIKKKKKGQCIYCSVPTRGLEYLIEMWPEIIKKIPFAKLYITSDLTLWGNAKQEDDYMMRSLYSKIKNQKNVVHLKSIPKKELVEYQSTSQLMLYPNSTDELFCISALECMSQGTVPITSKRAALIERVTDNVNGYLINGNPQDKDYQTNFINKTVDLLTNSEKYKMFSNSAIESAKPFSIGKIATKWINTLKIKLQENV